MRVPAESKAEIRKALQAAAAQIVATQKSFAPVDDGTLRNTIRSETGSDESGISVRIMAGGAATTKPVREGQSATYDYALGVEFGTAESEAQSFFFPGYRANKKRAKARVRRGVKNAAKRAVGK
ncbi:hypothetical protein GCM10011335_37260 [Aureimonas glaciei]|uniref:HK97 gp10 family phage protein n=2 Tax=Aureimonas glaciei TaxID=1776957 RepID=A0A917DEH1_9HYPH|nr:hypothetical protein GCM10011335_37260 [Aureimonas glaciei]